MLMTIALLVDEQKGKNALIEDLILEVANANKIALGELYECTKTDVFAFALSKMGNKFDAEDVLEDTYVNVFRYAKQYVPRGKPMAWIITIEHNIIKRFFNLKNRNVSIDDNVINIPSDKNLEETAVNNAYLKQLLSVLSSEEREIISLHVVTGLKHREIATLLNKPLATVLSQYNRAIKKLKKLEREQ